MHVWLAILIATAQPLFAEKIETPRSIALGQLAFYDPRSGELKRTTQIKQDDVLWMARMIQGEAGPNVSEDHAAALVWAILQRQWCWGGSFLKMDLRHFLQAYSEPINPTRTCLNKSPNAPCAAYCENG